MKTTKVKKEWLLLFCLPLWWCCGKKSDSEEKVAKVDSVALASTKDQILGVARIEPEDGLVSLTAGTTGRVLEGLIEENDSV